MCGSTFNRASPVRQVRRRSCKVKRAARGTGVRDELGRRSLGSPIRFRHEPAKLDLGEPQIGAHNDKFTDV